MVTHSRGRSVIVVLLLAILLALPAMPFPFDVAPAAGGQSPPGQTVTGKMDLRVDQAGIVVKPRIGGVETDVETRFVGNDTLSVSVPVLNYGDAHSSSGGNIPFFAWYEPY